MYVPLMVLFTPNINLTSRKGDTIGKHKRKVKTPHLKAAVEAAREKKVSKAAQGSMTRIFAYGSLNVHDIQRMVWGEAKEGVCGRIYDYELKLWDKSMIFYIEPKPGESVPGKMYELTEEQLKATDVYETDAYKRVVLKRTGEPDVEVYVRNSGKEVKSEAV